MQSTGFYLLPFVGMTFASVIRYILYAVYVLEAAVTAVKATAKIINH